MSLLPGLLRSDELPDECFRPPKGIDVFATLEGQARLGTGLRFRPPKGIDVFATWRAESVGGGRNNVSVPRRGLMSLLPRRCGRGEYVESSFRPPKGIDVFATLPACPAWTLRQTFPSPEGD